MPLTPTGFWPQLWRGKSIVRALMNVELAALPSVGGRVLDVGGTNAPRPTYRDCVRVQEGTEVVTVNLDAEAKPDVLADAAKLPIQDASFDHAWCFNLLEHVADPVQVLRETQRVLKPGAQLVSFTPFFVRIHGHPSDYGRYTEASFRRFAELAGFQVLSVKPVGAGPFVAAVAQVQPVLPRWLFVLLTWKAFLLDRLLLRFRPALSNLWPLGYLVIFLKHGT